MRAVTVQLIGGEMPLWSDLSGEHGPAPANGPALGALLASLDGPTLVAGPHAPTLLEKFPQPTYLVRGTADAESLGELPGLTVLCGGIEKLPADAIYDNVIALDGLGRLCSAETEDLTWQERLDKLLAVLRPGGRLLLGHENRVGLHRLAALPTPPADADWTAAEDRDPTRPPGPAQIRARLAAAGIPVVRDYAAYPAPQTPSILLGGESLELGGYLEAALARSFADGRKLMDPRRVAVDALRNALAAEFAPGWIILAGSGSAGPAGYLGELPLVKDGGRWLCGAREVPAGRTLEDLLLDAAQRRDQPRMRSLITSWLSGPAAGVPAAQVIVGADSGMTGLATAGTAVGALRQFADVLIDRGLGYLVPSPASPESVTTLLASMAGRELAAAEVPANREPANPPYDELAGTVDRLTRELAEARSRTEFLERMLVTRETALKRANQINKVLSATTPGKALVGGLRAARAVVRKARG